MAEYEKYQELQARSQKLQEVRILWIVNVIYYVQIDRKNTFSSIPINIPLPLVASNWSFYAICKLPDQKYGPNKGGGLINEVIKYSLAVLGTWKKWPL